MKVAVLASGGVDSSVALKLLKEQGHQVTAFYLKIWLEDELAFLGECPWEEDLKYVREICKNENIPLQIIPLQKEYFAEVVSYTINEVKSGRTPNPDILCNNRIKFGLFFDKIPIDEYDAVASGHYAQKIEIDGKYFLKKAPDSIKDQTYFLSHLKQKQLSKIIFPIGQYSKEEVRDLAEKFDLPNKNRKDSQGICFLGKLKFSDFIEHYLGKEKGEILEYETGKKLGTHDGFWYYTIGQRKNIRLPDGPWYVVEKDAERNIVYVSKSYHDEDKVRDEFEITDFNWFAGELEKKDEIQVKIRHGEQQYGCNVKFLSNKVAHVKLDQNDQGIAPGQFAVFYDEEICLGSAIIK